MSTPPQRVRVTRSRRPVRSVRRRTVREEIADESRLGSTYVNSLRRAQLHLSLGTIAVGLVTLGALPLLFALVPALRGTGVMGLPFAWVVLGLLVYPAVVLTARWYVRATERLEADFSELVSRR
ncbi:hypothetical protein NMQ01_13130 [Janibacter sp. CX7]|uniref:hypothetical protein n=1 Tax=Janibacter sp. CX7 TaxID=2963431 RepID=UPI0020CFA56E|nr:hypothetical protein [Janibacter sp. CX7]UTT65635.1 hypothetical protein NMQ01_13130 [Janibacter sp. CX7]